MARLIITSPEGKRGILELTKPVITIGRGNANDLVLNDSSVSRFHAVIKQTDDGRVVIADRGSTNGVVLNGRRIAGETELRNGDHNRIGTYDVLYESVEDSASLVIQKLDIPSSLDHVLRGEMRELSIKHVPPAAPANVGELTAQLRKLERENYLLTVLYDAGKALSGKLSIDAIAEQVMELAFRIEGVERGFMMLFNDKGEVTRQTEVRYRRPPAKSQQPQIILSRSVLQRLRCEMQPILITDAGSDERFSGSESMRISGLRSAMVAPLAPARSWTVNETAMADGSEGRQLLGILYVDNLERSSAFTPEELNVFALVAAQAAAAIDNVLAHSRIAEQEVQRSALERFLSPDVVEMIAKNPGEVKLGGSNQKVSVMFADIRGFTSMSETMPPEQIVDILNEYFTRVTDIIFDHGGTLDKYLGDGVMAVFGAPISKGNDAANAVRAAMAIQALLIELNRDAGARNWPELKVGIGINTGIVTAGNIGSPKRIDYTVVGDAVNVASRLMSNAAGAQILISDSTAQDLDAGFELNPLEPLRVKGKTAPLAVFSVSWMGRGKSA